MARFVFTEINGVLIPEASKFTAILLNEDTKAFKPSVDALNKITKATNAQLVVTSTWRAMGIGLLQDKFKQIGITATSARDRNGASLVYICCFCSGLVRIIGPARDVSRDFAIPSRV